MIDLHCVWRLGWANHIPWTPQCFVPRNRWTLRHVMIFLLTSSRLSSSFLASYKHSRFAPRPGVAATTEQQQQQQQQKQQQQQQHKANKYKSISYLTWFLSFDTLNLNPWRFFGGETSSIAREAGFHPSGQITSDITRGISGSPRDVFREF